MINIANLEKSYNNKVVFSEFNLNISRDDRIAITGQSGIGKTTLILTIAGILSPDKGEIISNTSLKPALVFQENRLLENATIFENIKVVNKDITRAELEEYLSEMGLKDFIDYRIKELSGGMKRRVAIIRAILFESNIVIMDEAIKEVDEESRKKIVYFINKYLGERPLIFVTHNERDLIELKANKIVEMGGNYEKRI